MAYPRIPATVAAAILSVAMAACTPLPDLEETLGPEPAGTAYPSLLPIGALEALDTTVDPETLAANEALEARAALLRSRAAELGAQQPQ